MISGGGGEVWDRIMVEWSVSCGDGDGDGDVVVTRMSLCVNDY